MKLIYRIIYSPPINAILRSINKALSPLFPKVRIPPTGVFKLALNDGKTIRFATNQTDPVAYRLYWEGAYSYEYIDIFEKIIKQCDSFIDIGSNAGIYSMIAATVNPDIKVIAFDPTNASTHFFNKNVSLNHLEKQITFFQKAITQEKGEISFYEVKNRKYPYLEHNLGGAASAVNKPKEYKEVKVQSDSLMGILKDNNLEDTRLDFVKIDAEGVEPLIVQAMSDLIKRDNPIIVCEVLFDQNEANLEALFLSHNYNFYVHLEEGLKKVDSIQRNEDNEMRNCFFVPENKMQLIQPFIID